MINPPELDANCKHRCVAVLVHTQEGCHIKKRNRKLVIHQKVSYIKQVKIGQF